jgi:hypothetical protein
MLLIRKIPFRAHRKAPAPPAAPPATAPVPIEATFVVAEGATYVTFDQPLGALGPWVAGTFQTLIPPDVFNMTGIALVAANKVRITTVASGAETPDQGVNYGSALHTIKGLSGLNAASFFGFPVEIV